MKTTTVPKSIIIDFDFYYDNHVNKLFIGSLENEIDEREVIYLSEEMITDLIAEAEAEGKEHSFTTPGLYYNGINFFENGGFVLDYGEGQYNEYEN